MKRISMIAAASAGLLAASPAQAIVGAAVPDESFAPHLVMLLRAARGSAFCTAVVIARNVLITAAHCVDKPENLRIYWPGGDLDREVRAVVTHPLYRPDAPKTRELSIDLALVRTAEPLPARFQPVPIDWNAQVAPGTAFKIAGYGVTKETDPRTAGRLHAATLHVREPISRLLIWAVDPARKGLGACVGDSGGPFFSQDGKMLAGVIVWSQGLGKNDCGDLTQGARLGPQRDFIEKTLRDWGQR